MEKFIRAKNLHINEIIDCHFDYKRTVKRKKRALNIGLEAEFSDSGYYYLWPTLKNNGIDTFEKLTSHSMLSLLKIKGIGDKKATEIEGFLENRELSLRANSEEEVLEFERANEEKKRKAKEKREQAAREKELKLEQIKREEIELIKVMQEKEKARIRLEENVAKRKEIEKAPVASFATGYMERRDKLRDELRENVAEFKKIRGEK